ncbi:hypothetical protein RND71_018360 [Anisodus tanguticus]|uniref:Uncharacterized protein n=1 Tax=Anisodus tanguticus TaxID=243964 RepID=A0AAE1S2L0_9SOLA|nr:hypothetical protein RND71_018360 [Anisodus tanguticus]
MATPPIGPSDLLITYAGPGGFSTVDAISNVAKSNGARVVFLTAQPDTGTSVKYASERVLLPMGSLYEGAMFVLFEMVVYKLGDVLKFES